MLVHCVLDDDNHLVSQFMDLSEAEYICLQIKNSWIESMDTTSIKFFNLLKSSIISTLEDMERLKLGGQNRSFDTSTELLVGLSKLMFSTCPK